MKKNTETFCHAILGLKVGRRKALANLLMALVSNSGSRPVTALSESAVYHCQYSSITKSIDALWSAEKYEDEDEGVLAAARARWREELIGLKSPYSTFTFYITKKVSTTFTENLNMLNKYMSKS